MAAGDAAASAARLALASGARSSWRRSNRAARRSSPTWCAPPAAWRAKSRTALWELVAAGLVTADGFENLRALIDPKRRARRRPGPQRASAPRRRAAGRCCATPRRAPDGNVETLRAPVADRWGVVFRDSAGARNAGARLARSAGCAAPHGSARRDPRRPVRLGVRRRAVRAARSARPAARHPPRPAKAPRPQTCQGRPLHPRQELSTKPS